MRLLLKIMRDQRSAVRPRAAVIGAVALGVSAVAGLLFGMLGDAWQERALAGVLIAAAPDAGPLI